MLERRFDYGAWVRFRIIHGRGVGVQREIVHSVLKTHPDVVSFKDAADKGSTYVRLQGEGG